MENPVEWFLMEGSATHGPISERELLTRLDDGSLSPSAKVAKAGWPHWSPAHEVFPRSREAIQPVRSQAGSLTSLSPLETSLRGITAIQSPVQLQLNSKEIATKLRRVVTSAGLFLLVFIAGVLDGCIAGRIHG